MFLSAGVSAGWSGLSKRPDLMEKRDELVTADFPTQLSQCLLRGHWCERAGRSLQPLHPTVLWPPALTGVIQGPPFRVPGPCHPAAARLVAAEGRLGSPEAWGGGAFLPFPIPCSS